RLNRFADRPSQRANYEAGESLPSPDCHDQTMSAPLPVAVHNRYCRETARRARDIPTPLVLACPGSRNIRLRLTNAGRVASRWKDQKPSWPLPDAFVRSPTVPTPAPVWRGREEISDRLPPPVPEGPWRRAHQTAAVW